ncbi:hypothetical protein, variant [Cladophialophora immunda]|uniref:Survival Motor Neuron Gemin2-binding domain-containing protein n=1 Tax=Cladophialophora immunda TaxID=569365 RepID=A0A0D2CK89_9EURO|nr:hypothetical protein, variant [Cladophialophora immunda]KIW31553.1 hypothetical protein, variant [Cladophialophora immunda]OQV04289.1 hypothetical protein CLAIMM_09195 isoform 2 [Cladophialophora immunda]
MPKNKKQKMKHSTGRGELSQAEIWDDSALIRSWNDAVAEYEYYHSIHARGEDVEEILRKAEMGELDDDNGADADADIGGQASAEWRPVHPEAPAVASAPDKTGTADAARDTRSESGEVEDEDGASAHGNAHGVKSMLGEPEGQPARPLQSAPEQPPTTTTAAPAIGPSLPPAATAFTNGQAATNLSQDQTLENIKMAYYWAGYYSGLYDGQRQAQVQAQGDTQHGTKPQSPGKAASLGQQ